MAGLIDALRAVLGDDDAPSFRLAGEDLAALSGARLQAAAASWDDAFRRAVPAELRARARAVHEEHAAEAHGWLRRWNRSVERRVRGYVALGRLFDFAYPWPVVAILGIAQVSGALSRSRLHGLLALPLARTGLPQLARIVDAGDDVLRRTNRGIFADSVPVVLWGLRLHALRTAGEGALADALLEAPPPPTMDEECVALARGLAQGLGERDPAARFRALAELTLRHFGREQEIFSFHLGRARPEREGWLARRLALVSTVPAPRLQGQGAARHVVFAPFRLPSSFDVRDHGARVAAFGDAFVRSVTGSPEDYAIAVRFVVDRWG